MSQISIGSVLRGRYRVIQLVGGGGMALVYRVEDLKELGRNWAMKVLHPFSNDPEELKEAQKLFKQEAQLLKGLQHPNLPQIVESFDESNQSFLVMEFIEGESLQDRLEDVKAPLPEGEVLNWVHQICDVLDYLHHQTPKIIFRDMKPGNVMVTDQGIIKLIDFGIARTYKASKKRDTITMGSANYAPLEQWGRGQTDARSDIYALGATMYHLLTNTLPPMATELNLPRPSSRNPSISNYSDQLIMKAMLRDSQDRYQSAIEMQKAVAQCMHRLGIPIPKSVRAPKPKPPAPIPVPARRAVPPLPPTAIACPNCRHTNRATARFCGRCGTHLGGNLKGTLDITDTHGARQSFQLEKSPFVIGRGRMSDGSLPDLDLSTYGARFVSRRHAQIERQGNRFLLTDLGSTNGTLLNGGQLAPRTPQDLRSGAQISIGTVVLLFRIVTR